MHSRQNSHFLTHKKSAKTFDTKINYHGFEAQKGTKFKNVRCPKHNGTIVFGRSSEADEFPKNSEKNSEKIQKFEKNPKILKNSKKFQKIWPVNHFCHITLN